VFLVREFAKKQGSRVWFILGVFFLGFIDPCFEKARRLWEQSNRTSGGGDLGFVVFVSYLPIR
jgi:hypothetical protein